MGTDEHKKLRIKKIQELSGQVGGGCFGQNRFYNPFWLFRAQLGFRIQVGAKCGKSKAKLGPALLS